MTDSFSFGMPTPLSTICMGVLLIALTSHKTHIVQRATEHAPDQSNYVAGYYSYEGLWLCMHCGA